MPKRRNTRRRRRRGGLSVLARPLSVLLAAVAIVAALTLFFKVEQIEVSGNSRYRAEEIVAASGVKPGDNLILFDKYTTSQRIYTQLPYITAVRIYRQFPATLHVEVTEAPVAAVIRSGGTLWLLGGSGSELKIMEAAEAGAVPNSLLITGMEVSAPTPGMALRLAEGSPVTEERLLALLTSIDRHGLSSRIRSADFSDPNVLVLDCDGRFRVELYYDADYDYKMNCLVAVTGRMEPNEQGTIRMTMQDDSEVRFIPSSR